MLVPSFPLSIIAKLGITISPYNDGLPKAIKKKSYLLISGLPSYEKNPLNIKLLSNEKVLLKLGLFMPVPLPSYPIIA